MAALLDAVGARNAIVGGLSLGGYMSLAFHRTHPDRVRALLIIDTGPGFKKDDARDAWNNAPTTPPTALSARGSKRSNPQSRAIRCDASRCDGPCPRRARHAHPTRCQRDRAVARIKVPSLVVVGANDTPFLAASDYMAAKIPSAQKVVIPAAGHTVNIDQPQAFIDAVLPFLGGLDAKDARIAQRTAS